jgi:hypothetical protein
MHRAIAKTVLPGYNLTPREMGATGRPDLWGRPVPGSFHFAKQEVEKRMRVALLVSMVLLLLAGCVQVQPQLSPLPTGTSAAAAPRATIEATPLTAQPQPTQNPEMAMVVGVVVSKGGTDLKSPPETPVRLARVFWNADKSDGAFVLEGATSPSTLINVPPADYVIVIGDQTSDDSVIKEAGGKARVITLEPGKTLDVGKIEVTPKP